MSFLRAAAPLLALAVILGLATTTTAQQADDLAIFFATDAPVVTKTIPGFVPDFFYVVANGVGDITGWEASVSWSDPTWNILGATLHPAGSLNVGNTGNFIVGLGQCVSAGSGRYTLVSYQIGYFIAPVAPSDVLVCVGPASPSSFGGTPGYSTCVDDLVPFDPYRSEFATLPEGCAVINCDIYCSVGTEAASIGALKAKF